MFETGSLSVWFCHALTAEGLPAICIDARHAKAALDMAANKTDANDADGLAHLAEVGFFREDGRLAKPAAICLHCAVEDACFPMISPMAPACARPSSGPARRRSAFPSGGDLGGAVNSWCSSHGSVDATESAGQAACRAKWAERKRSFSLSPSGPWTL